MRMILMVTVLTCVAGVALAGPKEEMLAADKAFAALSLEKGQAAAFLAYIDEDVRLFGGAGDPVIGRKTAEERYNSDKFKNSGSFKGTLDWAPIEAFSSRDGSMGWTNGRWTFTSALDEKGERAVAHGRYVTIWSKDASGAWKVTGDIGTTDPEPKPDKTK